MRHIVVSYYIKATDVKKMVTRFVVNYYILPIDVNAVVRQNVVITTFCNVTTFWVVVVQNSFEEYNYNEEVCERRDLGKCVEYTLHVYCSRLIVDTYIAQILNFMVKKDSIS